MLEDICSNLALVVREDKALNTATANIYKKPLRVLQGFDPNRTDWRELSPFVAVLARSSGGDDAQHMESGIMVYVGVVDDVWEEDTDSGCLVQRGLSHVLRVWREMPDLLEKALRPLRRPCDFRPPDVEYVVEKFPLILGVGMINITHYSPVGGK